MEPMTVGSPGGSPATSPYLPSFLLGEQQTPTTPRTNTLSPNKAGTRNLSFGFGSPTAGMQPTSPQEYNRSVAGQKTLFGGYQHTPSLPQNTGNYPSKPLQNHNVSGPPTVGLFDLLRDEQNQVQTPLHSMQPYSHLATTGCRINQSMSGQHNDSYSNSFSLNTTRAEVLSPTLPGSPFSNMQGVNTSQMLQCPPHQRYKEFWVTVFGFQRHEAPLILEHFVQCGTIVEKVFPSQNGNWVHLKYSSRLECDKALNYNLRILAGNIMIGVTQLKDNNAIPFTESICENDITRSTPRVRSLAKTTYKCTENDSEAAANSEGPQKSSGIMNKAIEILFGW